MLTTPVFGREHAPIHPLAASLAAMATSGVPELRALSKNLIYDHRVTNERDASLQRFGAMPWSTNDLQRAVVRYQHAKIRTRRLPEFVYSAVNGVNIVSGNGQLSRFNRSIPLARILDLNGLLPIYQWARSNEIEPFASWLPWPVNDKMMAQVLDATLNGTSPDDIETFITAVLSALALYSSTQAYQPVWCTTLADFSPFLDHGPDRWLEVLGVPPRGIGRWIIILTYPLRVAGTLVRPTQLDVGWDARGHFPSPPEAPPWRGGHPMDLAGQAGFRRLLPEYIHRQIRHTNQHWIAAGRRLGITTRPSRCPLPVARRAHHELLALNYGPTIYNWMPSSI
jgi:hypothetical protein